MQIRRIFALILFIIPALGLSKPVVIFDSGNTQPLPAPGMPMRIQLPSGDNIPNPEVLPVKTPSMSPGRVALRKINRPTLNRPVFIVGYDPLSLKWLILHHTQLKQLNALGIAVNVDTQNQLQQLIKAAGGIDISPVSGTAIAKQLRLTHYPALVSRTRIEQ